LEGVGGARLVVHGKGGKERVVPISDSLADAIRAHAPNDDLAVPQRIWQPPEPLPGRPACGACAAWRLDDAHFEAPIFEPHYRGTCNLRAVQMLLGTRR